MICVRINEQDHIICNDDREHEFRSERRTMPKIRQFFLFLFLIAVVDSLQMGRGAFASDLGSATGEADPADSSRIHEAPLSVDADGKAADDDPEETVQPAQYPP